MYDLLLPLRKQHNYLRELCHNYQLPDHASAFKDKNFLSRMLHKALDCTPTVLAITLTFYFSDCINSVFSVALLIKLRNTIRTTTITTIFP